MNYFPLPSFPNTFERIAWMGGDTAPENLAEYSEAFCALVNFLYKEQVEIFRDYWKESPDADTDQLFRNRARGDAWASYRESDLKEIISPNSSGQGVCPNYRNGNTALTHEILALGWKYSHSVYIRGFKGDLSLLHCFKHGEHRVIFADLSLEWQTSVSCASGRNFCGKYASELNKHLRNKIKRYKLKTD